MTQKINRMMILGLLLALLTAACQNAATGAGTAAPTALPTSIPPTATPQPAREVWLAPYIPAALRDSLTLPDGWTVTEAAASDSVRLEVGQSRPAATWVFALAAPFFTVRDGIGLSDLQTIWQGGESDTFGGQYLIMDEATRGALDALWGPPAGERVRVMPAGELLTFAWNEESPSWAILPFDTLEPKWKVLQVDGVSPLWKNFNPAGYGLSVPFSWEGDPQRVDALVNAGAQWTATNRDPAKMTTLVMTGVTALVRGTAALMELKGMTYPALDIGALLREADVTHISNEIPFSPLCPPPSPNTGLVFCSQPEYIELLESVGADVIELTGDHFADWGPEAMLYTLDMYKQRKWPYYGGGANLEEARMPLLMEHNGNKFAFLGCNGKPPGYATASATNPGANHCDFDYLDRAIPAVKAEGYIPIVTFQHVEYYSYTIYPQLEQDFRRVAAEGAAIVSGSQAHQPHAMEFYDGAFVHYGLGNLFFDQIKEGLPQQQAFIDRHVFYDGRYIGTELITIRFIDLARARFMTLDERQDLLKTVFGVSRW